MFAMHHSTVLRSMFMFIRFQVECVSYVLLFAIPYIYTFHFFFNFSLALSISFCLLVSFTLCLLSSSFSHFSICAYIFFWQSFYENNINHLCLFRIYIYAKVCVQFIFILCVKYTFTTLTDTLIHFAETIRFTEWYTHIQILRLQHQNVNTLKNNQYKTIQSSVL